MKILVADVTVAGVCIRVRYGYIATVNGAGTASQTLAIKGMHGPQEIFTAWKGDVLPSKVFNHQWDLRNV